MRNICLLALLSFALASVAGAAVYKIEEGYVDANGVMIYYEAFGQGTPLMIVHGGPGASHDYFLPYLTPLARHHRLIFIDERGSGRSSKLDNPAGYTVEAMADDLEAVRKQLLLGKVALLGHSYGGVLAQAYALKYQQNLTSLILCSTFYSTARMNEVFQKELAAMPADVRKRIQKLEAAGLFGKGKVWEKNRYPDAYMIAAWGEGYFPYLYQRHPDPNYDPLEDGKMSWDLYRQMWGSDGEFVIDGNLKSVEYAAKLPSLHLRTLVTAGDHDECDPGQAKDLSGLIKGSRLVIFPQSGHMTFVDQPDLFIRAIDDFLAAK